MPVFDRAPSQDDDVEDFDLIQPVALGLEELPALVNRRVD